MNKNERMEIDDFFEQKLNEVKNEEIKTANKINKKNKKGIVRSIVALALVAVTGISAFFIGKRLNNKDKSKAPVAPTSAVIMQEDSISLEDLGIKYDDPMMEIPKPQYGNTTGGLNKDDLVEKDGTIWKDQEAADNSDKVGKEKYDDNNGEYEVKPNGNVVEKEQGYEIQDEAGNIKEEGSNENGVPDGYAWDDVLGKYVKEEEVGKYVYADATYYDPDGTIVLQKGDIVLKETLEKAKKQFSTTQSEQKTAESETTEPEITEPETTEPEATESEKAEPETTQEEGITNPDGTYTIYGVTYKSKEDYHQFLLHPEQYGYYNGMVLSLEDIEELYYSNQKTK